MTSVRRSATSRQHGRGERDGKLLARCRAGDAEAWEQLLDDYERLVYSIPLRYGLSRDEAADVTQHVFTVLLQGLDSVRDEDKLGSWLATVARRESWRVMDRNRREATVAELPEPPSDDPTDAWVRLEWLHGALLALDGPCRELLVALYLSGEPTSYAEVSQRLRKPIGSIGPTRARCLKKLRELLEPRA